MFQVRGRDDYLMNASCSWCQLLKTPPSPGFFLFIHGYISSPYVLSSTIHLTTFEFPDISSEKKKTSKKRRKKKSGPSQPQPPPLSLHVFFVGLLSDPGSPLPLAGRVFCTRRPLKRRDRCWMEKEAPTDGFCWGLFFSKRALKKEMASYFNLQNRNPQLLC